MYMYMQVSALILHVYDIKVLWMFPTMHLITQMEEAVSEVAEEQTSHTQQKAEDVSVDCNHWLTVSR